MSEIDDDRLPRTVPLPDDQFVRWNEDTSRLFIVCNMARRFTGTFIQKLEHDHYPPDDAAENAKLDIAIHEGFAGLPWVIAIIPLGERTRAERVCKQLKLRLADGFPWTHPVAGQTMIGASRTPPLGATRFPLHSRRTYTLEPLHPDRQKGKAVVADFIYGGEIKAAWEPIRRAMERNQARTN